MKAKSHRRTKRAKPLDPCRSLRSERLETYSPLTLPQWAVALDVELRLEERAMDKGDIKCGLPRYYVYPCGVGIIEFNGFSEPTGILWSPSGNGNTPREALTDLAKQLQLQKVQLRNGHEFVMPLLKA